MSITASGFYVTGGTLRPDAGCYVERQADRDLCKEQENGSQVDNSALSENQYV